MANCVDWITTTKVDGTRVKRTFCTAGSMRDRLVTRYMYQQRNGWVGMMFEGGHPVTFAADGRLLYGDPKVVEKEIVCVVERTPGGRQEMVPYSEIQQLLKRTE